MARPKSIQPEQLPLPGIEPPPCASCKAREYYASPREACARELDARRCCVFCDSYRQTRSIEFGGCNRLGTIVGSGMICPHFTNQVTT